MPDDDLFLQTIEAAYASGLDSGRLPEALETTSRLLGANSATLEVIDKASQRPSEFWSVGLPALSRAPYIKHFTTLSPRPPFSFRQPAGYVIRVHPLDPFYSEILSHFGLHYFLGAVLDNTPEKISVISVQRTGKQGHAGTRQVELIGRLVPHFQRAQAVATRLKAMSDSRDLLEHSLDWLTDGAALLHADGTIIYANNTLRALAERGDGFRIAGHDFEFSAPEVRRRFQTALGAVGRPRDASRNGRPTDFLIPRADGMPAYVVSMRPIQGRTVGNEAASGDIMLLVRDPLVRGNANQILQELFGLTHAEAHLAQALCTGTTTGAYASERQISLNTVYSHLKRIREKTGCRSLPELIRKFGELNVPLRPN